jgi:hypothetical protein
MITFLLKIAAVTAYSPRNWRSNDSTKVPITITQTPSKDFVPILESLIEETKERMIAWYRNSSEVMALLRAKADLGFKYKRILKNNPYITPEGLVLELKQIEDQDFTENLKDGDVKIFVIARNVFLNWTLVRAMILSLIPDEIKQISACRISNAELCARRSLDKKAQYLSDKVTTVGEMEIALLSWNAEEIETDELLKPSRNYLRNGNTKKSNHSIAKIISAFPGARLSKARGQRKILISI